MGPSPNLDRESSDYFLPWELLTLVVGWRFSARPRVRDSPAATDGTPYRRIEEESGIPRRRRFPIRNSISASTSDSNAGQSARGQCRVLTACLRRAPCPI